MKKIVLKYKYELVLTFLILLYTIYFTTASFLRYDNFYTGRFDLGNMDQVVWNTINGRVFQASDDNGNVISRFSYHADFMLILLSPLYFIWSHPKMLLLVQSLILAFGAIFVYLITTCILKSKNLGLVFSFLFLMYPALQFANLYDFHAVTIATTTLLAAFYFLIRKKYFLMSLFLILSGTAKEQIWVATSIFGIPLLLQKAKEVKFLGSVITIFSLVIFWFLVWHAMPQSLGREHFALSYYSAFGDTPTEIVKNIIFSPHKLIAIFSETSRLDYLKQLFLPLGFISLLSPLTLIFSIPDLMIGLLSSNSQLRQIYYQYSSVITPFVFISAIFGIKNLGQWFHKINKNYIAMYLVVTTLLSAYLYGPLPGAKKPNIDMFTKPFKNKEVIENFISRIPKKHSVAATNNLGSHLSQREKIVTVPRGIENADIVLFLLNDNFAQPSLGYQKRLANELKLNKNYIETFRKDDFVVFEKR